MSTPEFTEFIKDSGGCLVSRNIIDGRGHITWARREKSVNPVDNGWRILSDADTDDFLNTPGNLVVASFNSIANIEPALIGIDTLPVGTDLQLVVPDAAAGTTTPPARTSPTNSCRTPHTPTPARTPPEHDHQHQDWPAGRRTGRPQRPVQEPLRLRVGRRQEPGEVHRYRHQRRIRPPPDGHRRRQSTHETDTIDANEGGSAMDPLEYENR